MRRAIAVTAWISLIVRPRPRISRSRPSGIPAPWLTWMMHLTLGLTVEPTASIRSRRAG